MQDDKGQTKKQAKRGLGRGLGSLLTAEPDPAPAPVAVSFEAKSDEVLKEGFVEAPAQPQAPAFQVPAQSRVWTVPIEQIVANPRQPRRQFAAEPLNELANSIRQKGILQPIVCRRLDSGQFEIVAGERRWRAAQIAGLKEVSVLLKETNLQEALELALIENIQRQDLNPVEEAEAYAHLMREYSLTQQQVADKVGKDRVTVANSLRLLNLSPEVREMLVVGSISSGIAKVLLGVTDHKMQRKIAVKVQRKGLTVRATERLIDRLRRLQEGQDKGETERLEIRRLNDLAAELQKVCGTRVAIEGTREKGRLTIQFYSEDQLNQIMDRMRAAWRQNQSS